MAYVHVQLTSSCLQIYSATAIEVVGPVGPQMSCYTLSVDDNISLTYNASAPLYAAQQTLGFITGLAQGEHVLTITNNLNDRVLALDSFNVWGSGQACFGCVH